MAEFGYDHSAATATSVVAVEETSLPSLSRSTLSSFRDEEADKDDDDGDVSGGGGGKADAGVAAMRRRYDPGPGCRPCCSNPHGRSGRRAGVLSTLAFAFAFAAVVDCHYLTAHFTYCLPPLGGGNDIELGNNDSNDTETCDDFANDLGLFYYAGEKEGGGLLQRVNPFSKWFSSERDEYKRGLYGTCYKYNFRAVSHGLWKDVKEIFGPSAHAAAAFPMLALLIGVFVATVAWISCCVAYGRAPWAALAACNVCGSILAFLTLVFFASDVCEHGCRIGAGAVYAVISGVCFAVAAIVSWFAGPYDRRQRAVQCCCCPAESDEFSGGITEIEVRRTFGRDGSVTTERVTTHPNGFRSVERTVRLADRGFGEDEELPRRADARAAAEEGLDEELERGPLLAALNNDGRVHDGTGASPANKESIEAADPCQPIEMGVPHKRK